MPQTGTSGRDHRDRVVVGGLRQGLIGLGYAALRCDRLDRRFDPLLTLAEVNAVLERVQRVRGSGSGSERQRALATQLYRINWRGLISMRSAMNAANRSASASERWR